MGTALRRKKRRNFKVSRVMVSDLGPLRVWGCGSWGKGQEGGDKMDRKLQNDSCIMYNTYIIQVGLEHIIYAYVDIYCDTVNMCEMICM